MIIIRRDAIIFSNMREREREAREICPNEWGILAIMCNMNSGLLRLWLYTIKINRWMIQSDSSQDDPPPPPPPQGVHHHRQHSFGELEVYWSSQKLIIIRTEWNSSSTSRFTILCNFRPETWSSSSHCITIVIILPLLSLPAPVATTNNSSFSARKLIHYSIRSPLSITQSVRIVLKTWIK